MSKLDFRNFEVLTFDCYGTLIDWETGIISALGAVLAAHGVDGVPERLLEVFAREEAAAEAGTYRRYRDILAAVLRGVCRTQGFAPTESEVSAFAGSVGDWPAFSDSATALEALAGRYRLGVITNCDDDLFARSNRRLGVSFEWVVTAQQVGSYKPDVRNFEVAFERIGIPRERILHVAQSLFHDHAPATRLGLATVWVNRRQGKSGSGATPPASAQPDLIVPDMASFAEVALA